MGQISECQKVIDGEKSIALLNEPSGIFGLIKDNVFIGLYVADTGNNCIRFIDKDGFTSTP